MTSSPEDPGLDGGGHDEDGPLESIEVGAILAGRYRILTRLGAGAMGAVYLGEHLKIGRKDAIKVLRPSMAQDREAIARFTRGARNASAIRHPNVCAIYDFGATEEGLHFLAMEFVEGGTLTDLLQEEGPLPPERAATLLVQAANALQVAHERGIVHRDLKPDNIMLAGGREQVKVVDFDIALGPPEGEGARVTRHGYVVGTPEYMSPEQLTGDPLDGRSDIYSLALVFFRMLTGRLPFDAGTAQEVMIKRLTEDPLGLAEAAPGLNLPPALEPVLRRALSRRREERPPSAAEFAREVKEAVSAGTGADAAPAPHEQIPKTEVSPMGTGPPSGWSPRRLALVGGGGAGLLALLLLWFLVVRPPGSDPTQALPPGTVAMDEEADPAGDETESAEVVDSLPPTRGDSATPLSGTNPGGEPDVNTEPVSRASVPQGGDAVVLPGDAAAEILRRQLLAMDPDGTDPPATLQAVRDTATAVWSRTGASRADSALAAYVLGSVLIPLGDSVRGVDWLEEAVRLDQRTPYLNLLRLHGRGGG
ncbi:MAG: protein kinase [Gemmatimonadota bacterium]